MAYGVTFLDQGLMNDNTGNLVYFWIGEDLNDKTDFGALKAAKRIKQSVPLDELQHKCDVNLPTFKTSFIASRESPQDIICVLANS